MKNRSVEKVMGWIPFIAISFGMLVFVFTVFGDINEREENMQPYCGKVVEDIISVSGGGFMSPSKCLLVIDGKKVSTEAHYCSTQIGEKVC